MKPILLTAVFFFTIATQAVGSHPKRLAREAYAVAEQLSVEEPYLSFQQSSDIQRHLNSIKHILVTGSEQQITRYTCTSRDNDDQAPYVLSIRQGVQAIRIAASVFETKTQCETALSNPFKIRTTSFICLSRDNDGRAPFQMASLKGIDVHRYSSTTTQANEACLSFVQSLRYQGGSELIFCGSRDNDGRAPFQLVSLNIETGRETKGNEFFNSIEKCKEILSQ